MEKTFARVEEMAATVKEYLNTRIQSVKLNAAEKSSGIIAALIGGFIVATFFLFFLVFISIALAISLGEWTGKPWSGYLIVGFLHLITGMIVWSARAKIIQLPIMNALIKQFFSNEYEED